MITIRRKRNFPRSSNGRTDDLQPEDLGSTPSRGTTFGNGVMNVLPFEKQVEAIAALTEGVSVRATERLTGVNRGTILSLGVRVGEGCAKLHGRLMRNL